MTTRVDIEPAKPGVSRVLYQGRELAKGRGAVVCQAARVLIAEGHDPKARLEAWRPGMLCLSGTIGEFAGLTVSDDAQGIPRFRKWQPFTAWE